MSRSQHPCFKHQRPLSVPAATSLAQRLERDVDDTGLLIVREVREEGQCERFAMGGEASRERPFTLTIGAEQVERVGALPSLDVGSSEAIGERVSRQG